MEKSGEGGAAVISSPMSSLCCRLPLVPVTVSLYIPGVAVSSTWTVSVESVEPSAGGVT